MGRLRESVRITSRGQTTRYDSLVMLSLLDCDCDARVALGLGLGLEEAGACGAGRRCSHATMGAAA